MLQNTFYILAILLMVLGAIFSLVGIGILIYIFMIVKDTHKNIKQTTEQIKTKIGESAGLGSIGTLVASSIFNRMKRKMQSKE